MTSNLNIHFSSISTDWETPQEIFDELNDIFQFNLDAAACIKSAKCEKWFGPGSELAEDALRENWEGTVWLNPPYGRGIIKWVQKAYRESLKGSTIVMLVPARPDTKWFQVCWKAPIIVFITGRLKFGAGYTSAPFPSCVVVFSQNLLPDTELNNLSYIGTVVRTLWHKAYREREPEFKLVEKELTPGVITKKFVSKDPEYRYLEPKYKGK
jgi:phage N-6-adenine-methyltransferase